MNEEVKDVIEDNNPVNNAINSIYEQMLHKEDNTSNKSTDKDNNITVDKDIKKNSDKENLDKVKSEDKSSTKSQPDQEEDEIKIEPSTDDTKYKDLEKQVNEAKKWGQSKNRQLINTKRKISELVSKLNEDGVLQEDNVQNILNSFNEIEDTIEDNQDIQKETINPFVAVREKIDSEFKTFKRYNKKSDADEKYEAFYSFFPMMSEKEQEESFNYLNDSEADVALDYIMTNGAELYETIFKGAKEKGSILKYVKSLQTKLDKLEKKSKTLESELDVTTKKVYNADIDSKAESLVNKVSTAQDFYMQRYQR